MPTFTKETLQLLVEDEASEDFTIMYRTIVSKSRWSVRYEMIFHFKGSYYRTYYSVGATEYQDESPYEHDDNLVEVEEVIPKVIHSIVYKTKRKS
jgi:hypothetical protein